MSLSSDRRLVLAYCSGIFAFLAYTLGCIIWFEHLIAEGRQREALDYTLTLITVYVLIVVCVNRLLTIVLQEGSVTFTLYIPAERRSSTVGILGNHMGLGLWIPMPLWMIYHIYKADSMAAMASVLSPVFHIAGYVCCVDTAMDLVRMEDFAGWVHHFSTIGVCLLMFELAPDFDPAMVFWSLQNGLDRLVWLLIFSSRMAHYRNRAETMMQDATLNDSADSSGTFASPLALLASTRNAFSSSNNAEKDRNNPYARDDISGLRDNAIDEELLPHIDSLPKWFSVAFVYYLGIRVAVCTMACVYLNKTWSKSMTYWKIITVCAIFVFTAVDVEAYKILYMRSSFGAAARAKEKGTKHRDEQACPIECCEAGQSKEGQGGGADTVPTSMV